MPYPGGVTYHQTAAALRSSGRSYPNLTTIAEFRPNSLTLHFHQLSRDVYAAIAAGRAPSGSDRNHVEAVAHELTHWSDQVGSVWGQQYLISLFDAYDAIHTQREERFHKVIELFDEERRILQPLYYRIVEKGTRPHDIQKPWRIEFSAGQEFGPDGRINPARPIFFVRFSDNETGNLVARQPITVGALLETTAMWAELLAGLASFGLLPPGERTVEQALWTRERIAPLYDPDLAVYTAPVHMLAQFSGTTDVLRAYEYGAALAHIALNLTGPLFDQLRHPGQFEPFGDRQAAFVHARDRGYAFAVLAQHASAIDIEQPLSDWLAALLQAASLPSYDAVMHAAYAHLDVLGRGLPVRSPLDPVRDYLLEIGRARFLARSRTAFRADTFDPLGGHNGPMPPMFDANADLFFVGNECLDPRWFDPEGMHYAEWSLLSFTDNFLQGCRGIERS